MQGLGGTQKHIHSFFFLIMGNKKFISQIMSRQKKIKNWTQQGGFGST